MPSKRSRWKWPWPPLRRGDVLAAFFVIFVLAFVLIGYLWFPFNGPGYKYLNSGPGWTCTYPERGEPVCVKDVRRAATTPSP